METPAVSATREDLWNNYLDMDYSTDDDTEALLRTVVDLREARSAK